ncbi:hypothetical protein V5E97_20575 [Singulisphaera sp. Ch08]|uniref:ABC transporter permease n=1 Tax=Singulisphaera sp. Ch08 TaxID=3120278 RepID=A0AAU7C705_9BACT
MSVLLSLPVLWSQALLPGVPQQWRAVMLWLLLLGEPAFTQPGLIGGLITWVKIISLFCLLGWVVSWVSIALKERTAARGNWLDIVALIALLGCIAAMVFHVMESTGRITQVYKVGPIPFVTLLALSCGVVIFLWIESALWRTIGKLGRAGDLAVLAGVHVALLLGLGVGLILQRASLSMPAIDGQTTATWQEGISYGARLSATYMGYVVLLRVLAIVFREVIAVRFRRIYSIALLTVTESNRRMWAPYVVITVFLVVLAFTHWFLTPPRAAEMGRLYVGTLSLLCSLLLTVMVTLLTPLSLPTDIQQQTIYTVVSKPVRRIELIWGRMLGFMTIVTFLVLVFGGISLLYLKRTVGGAITATEARAVQEAKRKNFTQANHLKEEAAQLRVRMSAREPVLGSLTFLDSKKNPHLQGIDVGQEQTRRSHIEGATDACAIWQFGVLRDPYDAQLILDRRIPVDRLLTPDSIEAWQDRAALLKLQIAEAEQAQASGKLTPADAQRLTAASARDRDELKNVESAYAKMKAQADDYQNRAETADKGGQATEAEALRKQAAALHSPPIPIEMTFNVYRTTKGRIGDPVLAEMMVTNPHSNQKPVIKIFPIREYYTNVEYLAPEILAGSRGDLRIEIRCLSPTQYLGMAENDLFIRATAGQFGPNYMKGLFGIWLQAMVLTAIGVFAGTFLSWPVALLTTIAFFVAGQVAFAFLVDLSRQSLLGGGPFESLIRLLTHDNQMSELSPTLAVVTAKTFDSIVMPVMSRLVYIVPNFAALDVSNTVADGFEVRWSLLAANLLLALAYALPFSIAGYFILKNREVAA